jgi:hypothetical protein
MYDGNGNHHHEKFHFIGKKVSLVGCFLRVLCYNIHNFTLFFLWNINYNYGIWEAQNLRFRNGFKVSGSKEFRLSVARAF